MRRRTVQQSACVTRNLRSACQCQGMAPNRALSGCSNAPCASLRIADRARMPHAGSATMVSRRRCRHSPTIDYPGGAPRPPDARSIVTSLESRNWRGGPGGAALPASASAGFIKTSRALPTLPRLPLRRGGCGSVAIYPGSGRDDVQPPHDDDHPSAQLDGGLAR